MTARCAHHIAILCSLSVVRACKSLSCFCAGVGYLLEARYPVRSRQCDKNGQCSTLVRNQPHFLRDHEFHSKRVEGPDVDDSSAQNSWYKFIARAYRYRTTIARCPSPLVVGSTMYRISCRHSAGGSSPVWLPLGLLLDKIWGGLSVPLLQDAGYAAGDCPMHPPDTLSRYTCAGWSSNLSLSGPLARTVAPRQC